MAQQEETRPSVIEEEEEGDEDDEEEDEVLENDQDGDGEEDEEVAEEDDDEEDDEMGIDESDIFAELEDVDTDEPTTNVAMTTTTTTTTESVEEVVRGEDISDVGVCFLVLVIVSSHMRNKPVSANVFSYQLISCCHFSYCAHFSFLCVH